ncbi:MAG: YraN family protein, partial [Anaerovoracaceae bacterium]
VANRTELGRIGEDAAAEMLKAEGYAVLERNYRCRLGEADIIAKKNGIIHIIEVKTRMEPVCGRPGDAVNGEKRARLRYTASDYLRNTGQTGRMVSFDVIEIVINQICSAF